MRIDVDRLARMGRTGSRVSGLRAMTLDSDGASIRVHLPTAKDLAACIVPSPGRELFKAPGAVVWRPEGSDLLGDDLHRVPLALLIDEVEKLLLGLPKADNEGPAYWSLRFLAEHRRELLRKEATEAARAFRLSFTDAPQPPKEAKPKPPPMTAAERKRRSRARIKDEETSSAIWALRLWLEDEEEAPEPGSTVKGTVAYEYAEGALANAVDEYENVFTDDPRNAAYYDLSSGEKQAAWDEIREEDELPPRPRLVSRQVLFRAAEDIGIRITRPKGSIALTIPERSESNMKNEERMYEELLDRMARLAYEEHRAGFDAYLGRLGASTDDAENTGTRRGHLRAV